MRTIKLYILSIIFLTGISSNAQQSSLERSLLDSYLGLTPIEIINNILREQNEFVEKITYDKEQNIPLTIYMKYNTVRAWSFNQYNISDLAMMSISNNTMQEIIYYDFKKSYTYKDTTQFTQQVGDTNIIFNFYYYNQQRRLVYSAEYGDDPFLLRKHYSSEYLLSKH